jgi:hypothetical protein
MVNLIKFKQKAIYPAGYNFSDDVQAANDRYNNLILPYLFSHGSIPVFASNVVGRFIQPDGNDAWDQVAIVRYQSRRALLEMAVELAGKGVDVHKWAAIEKTQVFPVRPFVSVMLVREMVAGVFIFIAMLLIFLPGKLGGTKPNKNIKLKKFSRFLTADSHFPSLDRKQDCK